MMLLSKDKSDEYAVHLLS